MCFWAVDFVGKKTKLIYYTSKPFLWLGSNPLVIFMSMVFLEIILLDWVAPPWAKIHRDGEEISGWLWIYYNIFASWIKPKNFASLMVSFVHLALWLAVSGIMYWKNVFIKL